MTTLVVGASGATGKHLVEQLLLLNHDVKVIVRSAANIPDKWKENKRLKLIEANVLEIEKPQMMEYLSDCDAIASCLGHNISLKGIFGKPRKLVTDACKLLTNSAIALKPQKAIKFVLMNTTANSNLDLSEKRSFGEKLVITLLRGLLPPQNDNECAANYFRKDIGQNHRLINWVVVRPDGLINTPEVSDYTIHPSPIRSPIFDAGKTSRINVGNFMARLISEDKLWYQWLGQMPVIYNKP